MKNKSAYQLLSMPYIAGKNQTYVSHYGTYRPKQGELLRANHLSKLELRELAFDPNFRLLYQQGKGSGKSLRMKPRHFSFFDGKPKVHLPFIFSIDTAQKGGIRSSRMVIQVWQSDGQSHYLVDVYAAVCDYETLWRQLKVMVRKYPPGLMLIEEASTGSALLSQAAARYDFKIEGIRPAKSKAVRIARHFSTIRRGSIHIPKTADWASGWIEEIVAFPNGDFDDNVDALSMLLDRLAKSLPESEPPRREQGSAVMVNGRGLNVRISSGHGTGTAGTVARSTPMGMVGQNYGDIPPGTRRSPVAPPPMAICATPNGIIRVRPK